MEELTNDLEQKLMISAFTKVGRIQKYDHIGEVTLGPNSKQNSSSSDTNNLHKNNTSIKYDSSKPNMNLNLKIYFNNTDDHLPFRHVLREYETQRQGEVRNAIGARLSKIDKFTKKQESQRKETQVRQNQELLQNEQRQEMLILNGLEQYDKKMLNDQTKLMQQFQDAAIRKRNQELALEEKEKQRQLINLYMDQIKRNQLEFRGVYQEIWSAIKSCKDSGELKKTAIQEIQIMKTLSEEFDTVISRIKTGKISEAEVTKSGDVITKIKQLTEKINNIVQTINTNIEKTEADKINEKQRLENELYQQQQQQIENIQKDSVNSNIQRIEIQANNKTGSLAEQNFTTPDITQYVSLSNLQRYTELMQFLENHTASFKELSQDASLKQFRFDCKKAINIPVNALSGINSEHILDKYKRLHALLSGANVIVSDKQINAAKHPQGIAFCLDLLAKKLVLQGDLMVSSNPESAFCYASTIVSLWNDFPVLGKLLLAYFYKSCPYLVPYYIPREAGESDEDYYTKRGYQYTDGEIEKQDKFLKRMTGIMRLYAAIMIAKPKRGQSGSPYNLKNGWTWLASVLKLEPQVDVTATMLHTFLDTVGFEMQQIYGSIFQRVLRIIMEKFLPMCKVKCTGGAVTRLELLFTEYLKKRTFEKPNGYIEYPYW